MATERIELMTEAKWVLVLEDGVDFFT